MFDSLKLCDNIVIDFENALNLCFDGNFSGSYIFNYFEDIKKDMDDTISRYPMIKKEKRELFKYLKIISNNLENRAKISQLEFDSSKSNLINKKIIQEKLLSSDFIYILDRDGGKLNTDLNEFNYGIPSDGLNHSKHTEFINFIDMFNNLDKDTIINVLRISLETYINRIFKELLTQLKHTINNNISRQQYSSLPYEQQIIANSLELSDAIEKEIDECNNLEFKISIDETWSIIVVYNDIEIGNFDITNKGTKGAAMDYIMAAEKISEKINIKTKALDALLVNTLGFLFKAYGDESYLHMLILITLLSIKSPEQLYLFYSHDKNLTNNVFNLLPHLYTINPALQLEVYTRQKDVYNRDIYYIVPARS